MSRPLAAAKVMDGRSLADTRICILHVPDCPLVSRVRIDVKRALAVLGLRVEVEEVEGPYPSPTLLVDGVDVTGPHLSSEPACRLDPPTVDEIVAAILAAAEGQLGNGREGSR